MVIFPDWLNIPITTYMHTFSESNTVHNTYLHAMTRLVNGIHRKDLVLIFM